MKRILLCGFLVALGLWLSPGTAVAAPRAWPITPPDTAFISGPGLQGRVAITEAHVLAVLRLGGLEAFDQGAIPAPPVQAGYLITRYFYEGTFNFGVLRYYPARAGARGYVYFADGPDLRGDHTAYHHQWFYTTPAGDAVLRAWLQPHGVAAAHPAPARTLSAPPAVVAWTCVALARGADPLASAVYAGAIWGASTGIGRPIQRAP
jgi:hypothetical protein